MRFGAILAFAWALMAGSGCVYDSECTDNAVRDETTGTCVPKSDAGSPDVGSDLGTDGVLDVGTDAANDSSADTPPTDVPEGDVATDPGRDGIVPDAGPDPDWSLAVGRSHLCILVSGSVYCQGDNTHRQLARVGAASTTWLRIPLPDGIQEITGSGDSACARVGSEVFCWGRNDEGQLGQNSLGAFDGVRVLPGMWTRIFAGPRRVCGTRAGNVFCWGSGDDGALGLSTTGTLTAPGDAVRGISGVTEVAFGDDYTCAAGSEGVACWGQAAGMRYAREPDFAMPWQPFLVDGAADRVTGNADHMCAFNTTDDGVCWGDNQENQVSPSDTGQLGVTAAGLEMVAMTAGGNFTCAISVTRSQLRCRGWNQRGSLGTGDVTNSDDWQVTNPALFAKAIWTGVSGRVCVRTLGDELHCWGGEDGVAGVPTLIDLP